MAKPLLLTLVSLTIALTSLDGRAASKKQQDGEFCFNATSCEPGLACINNRCVGDEAAKSRCPEVETCEPCSVEGMQLCFLTACDGSEKSNLRTCTPDPTPTVECEVELSCDREYANFRKTGRLKCRKRDCLGSYLPEQPSYTTSTQCYEPPPPPRPQETSSSSGGPSGSSAPAGSSSGGSSGSTGSGSGSGPTFTPPPPGGPHLPAYGCQRYCASYFMASNECQQWREFCGFGVQCATYCASYFANGSLECQQKADRCVEVQHPWNNRGHRGHRG